MSDKQKFWLLIGPAIFSFIMAMTTPIIQVYFIRLVDSNILAISNMLAVGIAGITNTSITKEGFLEYYDRHFVVIVLLDIIAFGLVSYIGMEWASLRYIGMAVINAISTALWVCIMQNAINSVVMGKNLTIWQSLSRSCEMYASLAGGAVILLLVDLDVELAIALQCLANLVMGLTDLKAKKLLIKGE